MVKRCHTPQWFVRKRHWFLLGQYYILFLKTLILTRKGLNLILSVCSIFLILDIFPLTYSCICLSYPSDPYMCTAKTADRKLITCLTTRVVRIFSVISTFSPKNRKMLGKSQWICHQFKQMTLKKQVTTHREKQRSTQTLQLHKHWSHEPQRTILYHSHMFRAWLQPQPSAVSNLRFITCHSWRKHLSLNVCVWSQWYEHTHTCTCSKTQWQL